jgi:hypothetical protein
VRGDTNGTLVQLRSGWTAGVAMDHAVIEIGSLPTRKSKAISIRIGSVIWPVAYFRDAESYDRFKDVVTHGAMVVYTNEDEDEAI